MDGLKRFDFFEKLTIDNLTQPTLIGSLLSINAISLIIFLLLREFIDYLTPVIKKESVVYHDSDESSKINVNFEVKFPKMPCHIISIDQEDSLGNHVMDISNTLNKITIEANGIVRKEPFKGVFIELDNVVKAINEKEGCIIQGIVPIRKVPGNIHVSHHNYEDIYGSLAENKTKISFNHKINKLFFGDSILNENLLERFGFNEGTSFNTMIKFPNYENMETNRSYDYIIKLIPHIFMDHVRGETFQGYQYSMMSTIRNYDPISYDEMPIIVFRYDISPIIMKYTLHSRSFAHSLTHICAIVGGVFVIFSIINRIVLALCEFSSKEKKLEMLDNR